MSAFSRINSIIKNIHPVLWHLICFAISVIVFGLILLNRSPNFLRPLSMSLRTGFGLVIPAATLFVYLAFRVPGRIGELTAMATVLSLFAAPLAGLWASGQTQSTVLSGLIPLYDASAYYIDALRLINGQDFSIFSARRPLFPGLLAVLLSITNYNLMTSLAILAGLVGIACYFTAKEIQRTHGAEMAVFILMILFLFYRAHSGVSMSENLGVALGALGFGLLWRGAADRSFPSIWLGLLIITLALNARAGTFFMLPLLILWVGWIFRENRLVSWKTLAISATAVILGFVLNLTLTRLVAAPSGVPFANFSYTLYGLASGGKSWVYIFEAHPEVLVLQEPDQSRRIYQLAFELIRENPRQAVQGAIFNWKMLFSNSWYNVYSYVGGENWTVNVIARWGMYLLSILGIGAWVHDRKDPIKSLVMISIAGVFISVPFLPPTDAYRMRPYAASIIILAALPAMGIGLILEKTARNIVTTDSNKSLASSPLITAFSIALIMITLIGPVLIKSVATPINLTPVPCASNADFVLARFDKGTSINIQKQNLSFLDWMPNYHVGLFRKNSHSLADGNMIAWTGTIEPAKTIFLTMDYHLSQGVMIVTPTTLLPHAGSFLQMCGQYQTDHGLNIFYVEQIKILPQ